MTREEVIRGLYDIRKDYEDMRCKVSMAIIDDALALLREQEPVEPLLQTGGNYVCGNCGMYTVGFQHPITGKNVKTWKYCGSCGKKVAWDG